ncbi:hypothetical protein [Clostridium thermosuccinogenes]|nr:hypothetical protein [Pseudoclostridium thermosuccinogenes]
MKSDLISACECLWLLQVIMPMKQEACGFGLGRRLHNFDAIDEYYL